MVNATDAVVGNAAVNETVTCAWVVPLSPSTTATPVTDTPSGSGAGGGPGARVMVSQSRSGRAVVVGDDGDPEVAPAATGTTRWQGQMLSRGEGGQGLGLVQTMMVVAGVQAPEVVDGDVEGGGRGRWVVGGGHGSTAAWVVTGGAGQGDVRGVVIAAGLESPGRAAGRGGRLRLGLLGDGDEASGGDAGAGGPGQGDARFGESSATVSSMIVMDTVRVVMLASKVTRP